MKPKRSKKQKLFELWVFFFPFLYLLLLPALFAYYPGAVTAWLDAWHILFGDLPNIAAFLYEAEYMVNKHGLSMPHTYYAHGFWICFAALSLSLYGLCRVLEANDGWSLLPEPPKSGLNGFMIQTTNGAPCGSILRLAANPRLPWLKADNGSYHAIWTMLI